MLSLSWNEITRRGAWTCLSCSVRVSPQTLAASSTARSVPSRVHQRRPSSSKNEHRTINAPSTDAQTPAAKVPKRSSTRLGSKSHDAVGDPASRQNETRPSLPSVPSTQHLNPLDIHVASFFAMHRPISITTAIPRQTTDLAFSTIFSPREQRRHEPSDVIHTISAAVSDIEDVTSQSQLQSESQEGSNQQAAIMQASVYNVASGNDQNFIVRQPQTNHISLQELAKKFRPFVAPPTPVPMNPKEPAVLSVQRASRKGRPIARKEYTTTLTITESTYPNGYKVYRARTSPMIGEPVQEQAPNITIPSSVRQPFLNHMREKHRQLEQWRDKGPRGEIWQALSVKRQRKHKMKKHKYKKLMRRTRTLRRKLDRL